MSKDFQRYSSNPSFFVLLCKFLEGNFEDSMTKNSTENPCCGFPERSLKREILPLTETN